MALNQLPPQAYTKETLVLAYQWLRHQSPQIQEIAKDKMPDLNCFTIESAMRMVAGTARSMGITVTGEFPGKNL